MSTASVRLPNPIRKAIHSGPALMENRRFLGIPREMFAPLAHFSVRKLATYEKEKNLPETIARPVNETMRLLVALREIVGDQQGLREWLETNNPAFDNRPPMQVIKAGESDLVWEMIHQVRTGTFA